MLILEIKRLQEALQQSPNDIQAMDDLLRLYEQAGRWFDVVKMLKMKVDVVEDLGEKARLYHEMASIHATRFSNQLEAMKALEAILVFDPRDAKAIEGLEQSYEKRRDWDKLFTLLESVAELEEDETIRRQKLDELNARSMQKLRRPWR